MPRITKSMAARLAEHKPSLSQAALEAIDTLRIRYRDIMNLKGAPATPDSMPKGEYRRVMAAAPPFVHHSRQSAAPVESQS